MLTLHDIQNIVNAVLGETEINDKFKEFALENMDHAINFIVRRDFPYELQKRYERTIEYYKNLNKNQADDHSAGLATYLKLSSSKNEYERFAYSEFRK